MTDDQALAVRGMDAMPGPRDRCHQFPVAHHLVQFGPRQLAQAEILDIDPKHPAIHADRQIAR